MQHYQFTLQCFRRRLYIVRIHGFCFQRYTFCNTSLTIEARVKDLISRINDTDKANMLTARGMGGNGQKLQDLPAIGVPGYYWGEYGLSTLNYTIIKMKWEHLFCCN